MNFIFQKPKLFVTLEPRIKIEKDFYMNIFSGNALWQLVAQSDAVSTFVLLILLCMSIACWAIFIGKLALFYTKERQLKIANKKAQTAKTISDLVDIASAAHQTAPGYFISKNLSFLKELTHGNLQQKIDSFAWELFEKHIDATADSILLQNEDYLSILSSCAAVGPLLGLFGTIWGLIHSFMRISEARIADIATIAPGIAEALITTIAGLIVAIPALVMFNYLQIKARTFEHNLFTLADRMTFILQQFRER
jgi:biopolymer transport protein TolQ